MSAKSLSPSARTAASICGSRGRNPEAGPLDAIGFVMAKENKTAADCQHFPDVLRFTPRIADWRADLPVRRCRRIRHRRGSSFAKASADRSAGAPTGVASLSRTSPSTPCASVHKAVRGPLACRAMGKRESSAPRQACLNRPLVMGSPEPHGLHERQRPGANTGSCSHPPICIWTDVCNWVERLVHKTL